MRLPRVQFTLRRMMVAVAIAGLAMGGWLAGRWMWVMWERRVFCLRSVVGLDNSIPEFQARADGFAKHAAVVREDPGLDRAEAARQAAASLRIAGQMRAYVEQFRAQRRAFEHVSWRPWLPLPPGPYIYPPPE